MAQMQTTGVTTNKPVMLVLHDIDLNSKLSLLRNLRGAGYVVLNTPNGVDADRAVALARNADAGAVVLWAGEASSVTWLQAATAALQTADLYLPMVIGGPAITSEIANSVAQVNGEMYRGGVYDYADVDEILQIFKYIVFYTPPPPAHSHEHDDERDACGIIDEGCATCASDCPMNRG